MIPPLKQGEVKNIVMRPSQNVFPEVALPFYPRTVGHFILGGEFVEDVPENRKHFAELFWCVSGSGEAFLNDRWQKVGPGDCFYRLPDERHFYRSVHEMWECRWVCFDGERASEFLLGYGYPSNVFHAGKCPEEFFIGIEKLMRVRSPFAWREMVSLIVRILTQAGGVDSADEFDLADRAAELCRKRFTDSSFNINVLTDMLGVNRSTLNRHFRDKMCVSPSEYLFQQRIQQAFMLLQKSRIPLAEIALQSGFSDMNYLCRVIRRATGKKPSQFREM